MTSLEELVAEDDEFELDVLHLPEDWFWEELGSSHALEVR